MEVNEVIQRMESVAKRIDTQLASYGEKKELAQEERRLEDTLHCVSVQLGLGKAVVELRRELLAIAIKRRLEDGIQ